MARKRSAIVGAGPIGLEAAILAKDRDLDVTVLERGRVAENVRSWGHVRLFSPFAMNTSPWGRQALAGSSLPASDKCLTGAEFIERYLLPLSQHASLNGCLQESSRVLGISRTRLWKTDQIGKSSRTESPFRILVESDAGLESTLEADVVLDCSGTYGNHNWLGAGGLPAPGERAAADRIDYELCDVTGASRGRFENKTVLVAGSGYSAATAVVALAELAPKTKVIWLTRNDTAQPLTPVANDPLPERARLTEAANAIAAGQGRAVRRLAGSVIMSIDHHANAKLLVSVQNASGEVEALTVDHVLALVGYRPDRSLYEELQVHECYATQGPIRFAASLLGETSGDCLAQSEPGIDTLRNPEPDFYILGAKSYGRDSRFLLRTGIAQVEAVIDVISREMV